MCMIVCVVVMDTLCGGRRRHVRMRERAASVKRVGAVAARASRQRASLPRHAANTAQHRHETRPQLRYYPF